MPTITELGKRYWYSHLKWEMKLRQVKQLAQGYVLQVVEAEPVPEHDMLDFRTSALNQYSMLPRLQSESFLALGTTGMGRRG